MKKISLFLSLLLAFAGAAKAQAQELTKMTEMPESGIYVIYATTNEANPGNRKQGYLKHDASWKTNRPFRLFNNVDLDNDGISVENNEDNLKFYWLVMKNDDGSYTMQNMSTKTYIPAEAQRNQNLTGSETANIMLEAVSDDNNNDNSLWYAYQMNYNYNDATHTNEKFYIYANTCTDNGANGNFSYWNGIDANGPTVRLTFYSLSSEQEENAVVAAAVENYETLVGTDNYVGAVKTPKCLKDLKANPTKQNLINFMSPMTLDVNVYYRIVCVGPKIHSADDTGHTALSRRTVGTEEKAVADLPSQSDVNQIWQFVPTADNAENSYYLKNLNNGMYMDPLSRTSNYRVKFIAENDAVNLRGVFEILSHNDNTVGQYKLHNKNTPNEGKNCLFSENNPNDTNGAYTVTSFHIDNDGNQTNASAWRLYPVEDIEMELKSADGEEYWGTGYMPFAVTPANAEIYTAELSGDVLTLHEATEGVQAEKGFIVKMEGTDMTDETPETPEKTITTTLNVLYEAESAATTSELRGTLVGESITTADNYYVLSYSQDNGVGFYHPRTNELLANKAYLRADNIQANMLRFDFGGTTTAIGAVQGEPSADEALYDLSGRRVTTPVRGIYVKGGKKVLMR